MTNKNDTLAKGLQDILDQMKASKITKEDLIESQEVALQIEDEINRRLGE